MHDEEVRKIPLFTAEDIELFGVLALLYVLFASCWLLGPIVLAYTFVTGSLVLATMIGIAAGALLAVGAFKIYLPILGIFDPQTHLDWVKLSLILASVALWPIFMLQAYFAPPLSTDD